MAVQAEKLAGSVPVSFFLSFYEKVKFSYYNTMPGVINIKHNHRVCIIHFKIEQYFSIRLILWSELK